MTKRVTFSEGAAKRIVAATRAVERGDRDMPAVHFRMVGDDAIGGGIMFGTFEGAWAKGDYKTITLEDGASVSAQNVFVNVGSGSCGARQCAVARTQEGIWRLVSAEIG